jgi:hypothetical protein
MDNEEKQVCEMPPPCGTPPAASTSSSGERGELGEAQAAQAQTQTPATSSAAQNADSSGGPSGPSLPGGGPPIDGAANDAIGVALAGCGMIPGPIGVACGVAGEVQNETIAAPNPGDPSYKDDKAIQNLNRGLAIAGVADACGVPLMSAAGPLGVVAATGTAIGHGAQAVGTEMIEQGIQKNPGQFGDDPMNNIP